MACIRSSTPISSRVQPQRELRKKANRLFHGTLGYSERLIASGDLADVNHLEADLPQFAQDLSMRIAPKWSGMKVSFSACGQFLPATRFESAEFRTNGCIASAIGGRFFRANAESQAPLSN